MEQQIAPGQMKELQDKLKNMTPEQVQEFQKKNCIFCQIVAGKIPCKKVYEDNELLGLLDINPASVGHVILLPKEHYAVMPQVPEATLRNMAVVIKKLSNSILKGIVANGTNIFIANGSAAGQKAPHFMVHVIPRRDGDNINMEIPEHSVNIKELKELKNKLGKKIEQVFGKFSEEEIGLADVTDLLGKEEEEPEENIESVAEMFKGESEEEPEKTEEVEKEEEPEEKETVEEKEEVKEVEEKEEAVEEKKEASKKVDNVANLFESVEEDSEEVEGEPEKTEEKEEAVEEVEEKEEEKETVEEKKEVEVDDQEKLEEAEKLEEEVEDLDSISNLFK